MAGADRGSRNTYRAWVEIDLSTLAQNCRRLQELAGEGVALLPVIKDDAYGHGSSAVARSLVQEGVWGFGVATVEEALCLRGVGVAERILLLLPPSEGDVQALVEGGVRTAVDRSSLVRALDRAAQASQSGLPVHLKVETGMGRWGVSWREVRSLLEELAGCRNLILEGLFTTLADAAGNEELTQTQLDRFRGVVRLAHELALEVPMVHVANSAALACVPGASFSLVRPGIFCYGVSYAAGDVETISGLGLQPVLRLRARIEEVRVLEPGDGLGYGTTYVAPSRHRVGIVPLGYGQGLPYRLSGRGRAVVNDHSCPILGAVSMDATFLDLSEAEEVSLGDVADFIGGDGPDRISVEEVAATAGTIPYEVLTRISPRLPRIWLDEQPDRGAHNG